jgi:hypothetical protein
MPSCGVITRSGRTVSEGIFEDKLDPIREVITRHAWKHLRADFVPVGARNWTPPTERSGAQKPLLFCRRTYSSLMNISHMPASQQTNAKDSRVATDKGNPHHWRDGNSSAIVSNTTKRRIGANTSFLTNGQLGDFAGRDL